MAQRAASYGEAVLHKSLTMKHCFRLHFITPRQAAEASQYEASPVFISLRRGKPFHSDMKHFAYAPYDLSSIALRATDDEKMENGSFRLQYIPCSVILTVERKTPIEKTSNKLVNLSVAFAVEILNIASVNTAKQNIKKVQ